MEILFALPTRLNFIPYLLDIYTFTRVHFGKLGEEERECGAYSTCGKVKKHKQASKRKICLEKYG